MCMSYFAYLKQGEVIYIEPLEMEVPVDAGKGTKKSAVPEVSKKGKDGQVFSRNLCEHVCTLF